MTDSIPRTISSAALARLLRKYGEPAATLGSAVFAEPVAGWAGLLTGNPANVAKTREMLTYAPRSAEGRAGVQALGSGVERAVGAVNEHVPEVKALVDAYGDVADYAGELHPALGAGMKALPAGAAALFGPGGTATRAAFKNVASEALRAGKGLPVGLTFVTEKSKTWDVPAHITAQAMEASGADARAIWRETGNWRAPDGEWRQEIPDDKAKLWTPQDASSKISDLVARNTQIREGIAASKLHPDLFPKELSAAAKALRAEHKANVSKAGGLGRVARGDYAPASAAYEHPELYQAFPQAADYVVRTGAPGGGARGAVIGRGVDVFDAGLGGPDRGRSTASHEFQHVAQDLGGAPQGSNPEYEAQRLMKRRLDDLRAETGAPHRELVQRVNAEAAEFSQRGKQKYLQRLGEAEARATQARRELTGPQRREVFPEDSFDLPMSAIIPESPGGGPHAASIEPLTLDAYHFSKAPRTQLDPNMFGTGLKGNLRDAQLADKDLAKQVSFYVPKGGVVTPEAGVGGVAHKSALSGVYDADADSLRLVTGNRGDTVRALKKAGFTGMLNRMPGSQPGQVIMFTDKPIPTTSLGSMSKIEGLPNVPPPQRAPALGRDIHAEAVQDMKDLPAGQLSPASWKAMLTKRNPQAAAAFEEAGLFQPGAKSRYKDELVGDYKRATEAPDYLAPATPVAAERTVAAPKQVAAAERYQTGDKKGIYRGSEAFGGVTPQKMTALRAEYLRKMEEGAPARHWYDQSSDDIYRWTGGDFARSDLMANMLAETSANTPVASNLMYANKGWNQYLLGEPVKTGQFPNVMGAGIDKFVASPELSTQGLKRSAFAAGLSTRWRGADFASRPTHDIHQVRAWGFTAPKTGGLWSKGVSDAGHRFLDAQSFKATDKANQLRLGGADDWNPYRAQAAAWISQKAKTDATPLADAARHYGSFAPEYQTQITREWAPGTNTGHMPEYHALPDEAKQDFARRMEQHVVGREGIDALASDAGALVDRTHPNVGSYEGATEPGFITPMNVGKDTGSHSMDPASQKVADAIAAAHGILGVQKQVAHNFLSGNAPLKSAVGVRFPGGFVPDDEMKALAAQLRAIDPNIVPQRDVGGGVRMLRFPQDAPQGPYAPGAEQKAADRLNTFTAQQLRDIGTARGSEPTFHEMSGNLIPFDAPDKWSAKPFVESIEASGPKMEASISQAMQLRAQPLLQEAEALAQQYKLTNAPYYRTMMEGIAQGGLPRLKELIASGAVPAVFMSVGGEQYDLGP